MVASVSRGTWGAEVAAAGRVVMVVGKVVCVEVAAMGRVVMGKVAMAGDVVIVAALVAWVTVFCIVYVVAVLSVLVGCSGLVV